MKYKILILGNNKNLINQFFDNMGQRIECISSSDRFGDIMNHIKYLSPDAFVLCLNGENFDKIKKLAGVMNELHRKKIPVFVIGDTRECSQFEKTITSVKANIIDKTLIYRIIEEKIVRALEDIRRLGTRKETADMAAQIKADASDAVKEAEKMISKLEVENENRRRHILVVDDDSSVLKLIKSYLSGNYDVATAKSGKVALKFLETKKTDLVLLDYEMPGEKGPEVLSKIRADARTKDLPVVFLTGVTDKEKIQDVLAMKPQGYLLKPIDMMKLSSTIKNVLS
ncbi:MAG: response regulator [Lachnospiraceae bacterium]|nr:response regulator [Lachnospiraceae bacterium]